MARGTRAPYGLSVASSEHLADAVRSGDRSALARAITLVESRRAADLTEAEAVLAALLPHSGRALRVGVTGAPGVGKSTLIEGLGTKLCDAGRRVAVLAVDPSSSVTGGDRRHANGMGSPCTR